MNDKMNYIKKTYDATFSHSYVIIGGPKKDITLRKECCKRFDHDSLVPDNGYPREHTASVSTNGSVRVDTYNWDTTGRALNDNWVSAFMDMLIEDGYKEV